MAEMTREQARERVRPQAETSAEYVIVPAEALRVLLAEPGTCATCQHWQEGLAEDEPDECHRLNLWTPTQPFGCSLHTPSREGTMPEPTCQSCRRFIDYTDTEPPDEVNGYCDRLGEPGHEEYGGYWTHAQSWCRDWQPRDSEGRGDGGEGPR